MKVFVSWSGETSNKIAEAIKEWLPICLQSVEVFCSSTDIEKGENWNAKLTSELESTHFGIVCLTEDNVIAPWLHFEAGALSKMLGSKVCAIATNIEIVDIKGPLASFQACKFTREDFKKMVRSINNSDERKISDSVLESTFDLLWPQLEDKIKQILIGQKKNMPPEKKQKFNQNEVLEELIQLTRMMSSKMYLLNDMKEIISNTTSYNHNNFYDLSMDEIYDFTKYLLRDYASKLDIGSRELLIESIDIFINRITRDDRKWNLRFRSLIKRNISSPVNIGVESSSSSE